MISTDRLMLKPSTHVYERMQWYGKIFEELHVIVYTARVHGFFESKMITPSVRVYPTNSRMRALFFLDGYKIAGRILRGNPLLKTFIISAQDPFETGFLGYLLRARFSVPLQVQLHTDFASTFFWRESFHNKIRVLLGTWILARADRIRVVSVRIQQSLERLMITRKPAILPVFVDVERITSAATTINLHKKYPHFRHILLAASRLTKEKNISMAVSAMPNVLKQYPNTLLLIVGDGEEKIALIAQAAMLGIQKNTAFEPWTEELISYYKTADLFLLTSNYEGYGRTVVEALAAGCSVVMTDVGVAGEIVQDGISGFIVPVGDVQALSKKIIACFDMPNAKEHMRASIREAIARVLSKENYLKLYYKSLQ